VYFVPKSKKSEQLDTYTMVITAVVTEEAQDLRLVPEKPKLSLPHAESSNGRLVLMDHGPNSGVDFGAEVYGIDLNNFTDADFAFIHDALHRHKLLVFKEQPSMLSPQQQYKLTSKLV
jgi:xanthine dioxygenase